MQTTRSEQPLDIRGPSSTTHCLSSPLLQSSMEQQPPYVTGNPCDLANVPNSAELEHWASHPSLVIQWPTALWPSGCQGSP